MSDEEILTVPCWCGAKIGEWCEPRTFVDSLRGRYAHPGRVLNALAERNAKAVMQETHTIAADDALIARVAEEKL